MVLNLIGILSNFMHFKPCNVWWAKCEGPRNGFKIIIFQWLICKFWKSICKILTYFSNWSKKVGGQLYTHWKNWSFWWICKNFNFMSLYKQTFLQYIFNQFLELQKNFKGTLIIKFVIFLIWKSNVISFLTGLKTGNRFVTKTGKKPIILEPKTDNHF